MSDALRDYGQRDETVCVKESEEIANEKRMMSILLCLVMAVGLLPTTALAAVVRDEEGMISYEPAEQGVYRMVCEFDGKLYFAGMGNPTATLVEVDPATNEARIAYYNIRYTRGVSNGVHGLLAYDGEILMCLATDNYDGNKTPGGIIVASSNPSADLNSWRVIADQDDFDGLPAVMQVDGPIGNLGAGLGNNSNQYVWRMGVHNGEFYIGTYDTSTLTYNFTQITDGTVANMEYDDISGRADALHDALDQVLGEYKDDELLQWFLNKTIFSDYTAKLYQKLAGFATDMSADKNPVPDYRKMLEDYESFKKSVYGVLDRLTGLSAKDFLANCAVKNGPAIYAAAEGGFASDPANGASDLSTLGFVDNLKKNLRAAVDKIFEVYDKMVYDETIHNFVYYFGCNYYAQQSERGFDLLVSNDGVNFDAITRDGLGDGSNHGLRCIASTSQGVFLGTANPYYGTQLWLMHSDADQQPEKAPEVPDAKDLPESYVVRCTTDNSGHAAVSMSRIAGTAVIGEVAKSDDGYTCPVTVSTEAYAAAYAAQTGKAHTAAAGSITFNMTWDGEKWTAPTETDLPVIDVVCTADSGSTGGNTGDGGSTGGSTGGNTGDSGSTGGAGIGNVYPVEVLDSANGAVTSSHKTASAGTVVTIKTAPAQGYALSKLIARDSGGSHRENSALKSSRRYLSGSFFVRTHTFSRVVSAPAKAALTG